MSTSTERMRRMRARQRAGLEAVPDASPRDPDELVAPSVRVTIAALKLGERDTAIAQLALRYATAMDDAEDPAGAARVFGPLLHKALESLKATPASRNGVAERPEQRAPSRLAQLRAAHAQHPAVRKRGF